VSDSKKKSGIVNLHPEVAKLAKDFQLRNGQMSMPDELLARWFKLHSELPAADKAARSPDVVALAVRFNLDGGPAASKAVDQLCVLAAALLGDGTAATTAFKSAGLSWSSGAKKEKGR
jgi:hypothetical protein